MSSLMLGVQLNIDIRDYRPNLVNYAENRKRRNFGFQPNLEASAFGRTPKKRIGLAEPNI